VDVWPTLQHLDQSLDHYDYDYFPRGRVNWRKEDDRWFIAYIVLAWKIPRNRLIVLTDAHYRSMARVGAPQDFK
jgi:hypothetical protein